VDLWEEFLGSVVDKEQFLGSVGYGRNSWVRWVSTEEFIGSVGLWGGIPGFGGCVRRKSSVL